MIINLKFYSLLCCSCLTKRGFHLNWSPLCLILCYDIISFLRVNTNYHRRFLWCVWVYVHAIGIQSIILLSLLHRSKDYKFRIYNRFCDFGSRLLSVSSSCLLEYENKKTIIDLITQKPIFFRSYIPSFLSHTKPGSSNCNN